MAKKQKEYNRADILICKHKFGLDEDKQYILRDKYKTYKDILQLTKDVFENPILTENSPEYKKVRDFVARLHTGTEAFNFTEDQINYIAEHGESMRPMDITRAIFPDASGPQIREVKAVALLVKALGLEYTDTKSDGKFGTVLGAFEPPDKDHGIIKLINENFPDTVLSLNKLDSDKRRCIAFLKRHLCSDRFKEMASLIRSEAHRRVFLSEFVKVVADKPDLAVEEVNGYMNLANEYVLSLIINEQIMDLNDRLKEATDDDDEGRKYTKNIADSLSTKTKEYNDCQNRMKALHRDLNGIRSQKLDSAAALKDSLGKYIELAKSEEGRLYMLKLGQLRRTEVEEECNRIKGLGDLAESWGVSIEEILKY